VPLRMQVYLICCENGDIGPIVVPPPCLPRTFRTRQAFHAGTARAGKELVTGASKGIGAVIAKGLSAAGALVIRSAALEPRGYAETRGAARAAFAKSWRRE
jgi:hypothetical protein